MAGAARTVTLLLQEWQLGDAWRAAASDTIRAVVSDAKTTIAMATASRLRRTSLPSR
jgi:hypothetical protein